MSASLVGSEMCIRDSLSGACDDGRHINVLRPEINEAQRAPVPPSPFPTPVSYTHLTLPTICSV
eukprot:8518901-Alexandrium_andersonii.AAC.1